MLAAVAGTAVVALVATRVGAASALSGWLDGIDPFVANLVLTLLVAPWIAWALVAHRRQHRSVGAQRELSRLSRHDPLRSATVSSGDCTPGSWRIT